MTDSYLMTKGNNFLLTVKGLIKKMYKFKEILTSGSYFSYFQRFRSCLKNIL